jgi:hypothetical protein
VQIRANIDVVPQLWIVDNFLEIIEFAAFPILFCWPIVVVSLALIEGGDGDEEVAVVNCKIGNLSTKDGS